MLVEGDELGVIAWVGYDVSGGSRERAQSSRLTSLEGTHRNVDAPFEVGREAWRRERHRVRVHPQRLRLTRPTPITRTPETASAPPNVSPTPIDGSAPRTYLFEYVHLELDALASRRAFAAPRVGV